VDESVVAHVLGMMARTVSGLKAAISQKSCILWLYIVNILGHGLLRSVSMMARTVSGLTGSSIAPL
jgi:hypothetical protein